MNYPTMNGRRYNNTAGQMNTKEDIAAEIAGRSSDAPAGSVQASETQKQAAAGLAQQTASGSNAMTGGGNAMTNNIVMGNGTRALPNGVNATPNGGQIMYKSNDPNGIGLNYTPNGGQIVYGTGPVYSPSMTPSQAAAQWAQQRAQSRAIPNDTVTQIPNGPQFTPNGATAYTSDGRGNAAAYTPVQAAASQASAGQMPTGGSASVWVRGYADAQGLGNLVTWDEERGIPLVGGVPIPYDYISDGRAYASQGAIDAMLAQYKKQTNTDSPTGITDNVMDRYDNAISKALKQVTNRKDWSYDPDKDPAYKAYAAQYARNAEKAYSRAMGSGGLYSSPNSYQYYQALTGYGDNMQQLSDMVPTLAQQSYQRYADEQNRNRVALEALQAERSADLNARYNATLAQLAQQRAADETDYQRRQDALYNDPARAVALGISRNELAQQENATTQSNYYTQLYPEFANAQLSLAQAQTQSQIYANTMTLLGIVEKDASISGRYNPYFMQQLGIAPRPELAGTQYYDENGYPLPGTEAARIELNVWNIAGKQQLRDQWNINNGLG